jgi:membrane protein
MKLRDFLTLAKESFRAWSEDKAARLAAALAYYTIFSIPPLLLISLAVAGVFLDEAAAQNRVVEEIGGLVGQQGAEAIQAMIASASKPGQGLLAGAIGLVALLLGASGVFGQLHDALNTIWEVEQRADRGVLGLVKDRFLSFTMVLGIAFLLLVSLVITAALSALDSFVAGLAPGSELLFQLISFAVSLAVTIVLFALIFKVVPDAEIAWRDVWVGAAVTAILFTAGKTLIGLYLGKSATASAFGAAGSLVVLLLWVYYSAQILFLGAEFTQVYANLFGAGIRPDANAVPLTEQKREQQGIPHRAPGEAAAGRSLPEVPNLRRAPAVPLLTAGPSQAGQSLRDTLELVTIGLLAFAIGAWRWLRR